MPRPPRPPGGPWGHGHPGAPPWGGPGSGGHGGHGGGPPWGDPIEKLRSMFGGGRGSRRGRGDVRAAVLLLLGEQASNGYQLMQEIERRSEGTWRPSSGSIYPTLQLLEDEGLVTTETNPAGRVFKLTDRGKKYLETHREELGTPWESETSNDPRADVMRMLGELGPALGQVCRFGTPEQIAQARKIMADARRALYGLLAEDDTDE